MHADRVRGSWGFVTAAGTTSEGDWVPGTSRSELLTGGRSSREKQSQQALQVLKSKDQPLFSGDVCVWGGCGLGAVINTACSVGAHSAGGVTGFHNGSVLGLPW